MYQRAELFPSSVQVSWLTVPRDYALLTGSIWSTGIAPLKTPVKELSCTLLSK